MLFSKKINVTPHKMLVASSVSLSLLLSACASAPQQDGADSLSETSIESQAPQTDSSVDSQNAEQTQAQQNEVNQPQVETKVVKRVEQATAKTEKVKQTASNLVSKTEDVAGKKAQTVKKVEQATATVKRTVTAAAKATEQTQPIVTPEKTAPQTTEVKKVVEAQKSAPKVSETKPAPAKPVHYGNKFGSWILEKGWDAENKNNCRLRVGTRQVQRGAVGVQYWIALQPTELKIYTSSQIDASTKGSGIQIDGGELMPFTRVDDLNNPVLEKDITEQLAKGRNLNINLGFSFLDPQNPPEHIQVKLTQMDKGIAALKACR